MKNILKIAVEAIAILSLIALLGLVAAFAFTLLALLPANASEGTATRYLPTTAIYTLAAAAKPVQITIDVLSTVVDAVDYSKLTIRDLRPMARDRHIPKWNKLNKQALIEAIRA